MIQERLEQLEVEFEAVNLVNKVPSEKELGMLLMAKEWRIHQLFNFNSSVYRRLKLDDVVYDLNVEEAFEILRSNGRLIPSPFIVTESGCHAPVEMAAELEQIIGLKSEAA